MLALDSADLQAPVRGSCSLCSSCTCAGQRSCQSTVRTKPKRAHVIVGTFLGETLAGQSAHDETQVALPVATLEPKEFAIVAVVVSNNPGVVDFGLAPLAGLSKCVSRAGLNATRQRSCGTRACFPKRICRFEQRNFGCLVSDQFHRSVHVKLVLIFIWTCGNFGCNVAEKEDATGAGDVEEESPAG